MVDPTPINFKGRGANVVGSLGEASMVQDMPTALEFNWVDTMDAGSYVNCGDITYPAGDLTWSGWSWLDEDARDGGNSYPHLMGKGDDWFFCVYGQSIYFYIKDSAGHTQSDTGMFGGKVGTNTWNHVAVTWDSTTGDIIPYLNGVSGATLASTCVTQISNGAQ